ncbi:MAG: hypothetical protein ACI9K2_007309 [Myxococcota bacterium]|jgi:hypothetical protein
MILAAAFGAFSALANPMLKPRDAMRRLDCERLTVAEAQASLPGLLPPEKPRGDYLERSVLHCRERLAAPDLRSAQDEAILLDLDARATTLAEAATGWGPLEDRVWLVETNVSTASLAPKIGFATKAALMRRGMQVSDRMVMLGAGDVDVITRMDPMEAYPTACRRYGDTGSLRAGDVLLVVMLLDPRETRLHAGLCIDGGWTWLR